MAAKARAREVGSTLIQETVDYGVRHTRGRFLTVVPVPGSKSEGGRNCKFELYNNRARATRPIGILTTSVGTIIQRGMVKPSFFGTLEIRPDVPFSQMELNDLPTDVATLMFRVLGGNPENEEFIVKITCPNLDDPDEKEYKTISESWMGGEVTNLKHYSMFTGRSVIMSSG